MQAKEGLFLALLVVTLLLVASYMITLGLTNFSSYNKAWDNPSKKLEPSTADAGGREGSEVSSNSLDKYQKKRRKYVLLCFSAFRILLFLKFKPFYNISTGVLNFFDKTLQRS